MNHEELRDQYELYALGVAGDPERNEIREHLSRGCEVCMTEMNRAHQLTALLGMAAQPAAPSPKLRRRILASIGFEQLVRMMVDSDLALARAASQRQEEAA